MRWYWCANKRLWCAKGERLLQDMSIPFDIRPKVMKLKFGNTINPSQGTMKFRFPCPSGCSIDVYIYVVDLDVPLLLDLRELWRYKLLIDYLTNSIESKDLGWKVRLRYKFGHIYWDLAHSQSFYSGADIKRLQKHFLHPYNRKLYKVLKRSDLGHATQDLRQLIEDVSQACD